MQYLIISAALLVCLFAPSEAHYFFTSSIHDAYKGVLPGGVADFYAKLNPAELEQVKLAGVQLDQGGTDAAALRVLKTLNEPLHVRVEQSRDGIQHKIDSLDAEAMQFVNSIIAQARSLRPETGEQADTKKQRATAAKIINEFNALSAEAKASLAQTFPEIAAGVQGEQFSELASAAEKEL